MPHTTHSSQAITDQVAGQRYSDLPDACCLAHAGPMAWPWSGTASGTHAEGQVGLPNRALRINRSTLAPWHRAEERAQAIRSHPGTRYHTNHIMMTTLFEGSMSRNIQVLARSVPRKTRAMQVNAPRRPHTTARQTDEKCIAALGQSISLPHA